MFRNQRSVENARELRVRATEAEQRLWRELRSSRFSGIKFRRQHAIGKFIVDFCAPSRLLVIEVDGGQHQKGRAEYDEGRTRALELKG